MNRFFSLRPTTAALVAVAILGFTHDVSGDEYVPFKGVADAVVTGSEPGADGLHLTLAGTGQATHLGRFTREEDVVIHADSTVEGTVVFIAANGDRLYAAADGGFISPTTVIGTYTLRAEPVGSQPHLETADAVGARQTGSISP